MKTARDAVASWIWYRNSGTSPSIPHETTKHSTDFSLKLNVSLLVFSGPSASSPFERLQVGQTRTYKLAKRLSKNYGSSLFLCETRCMSLRLAANSNESPSRPIFSVTFCYFSLFFVIFRYSPSLALFNALASSHSGKNTKSEVHSTVPTVRVRTAKAR